MREGLLTARGGAVAVTAGEGVFVEAGGSVGLTVFDAGARVGLDGKRVEGLHPANKASSKIPMASRKGILARLCFFLIIKRP